MRSFTEQTDIYIKFERRCAALLHTAEAGGLRAAQFLMTQATQTKSDAQFFNGTAAIRTETADRSSIERGFYLLKRAIEREREAEIRELLALYERGASAEKMRKIIESAFIHALQCDNVHIARLIADSCKSTDRFALLERLASQDLPVPPHARKNAPFALYGREDLFALTWFFYLFGFTDVCALLQQALPAQDHPAPYCLTYAYIHHHDAGRLAATIALILHNETDILDVSASAVLLKTKQHLTQTENLLRAYVLTLAAAAQSVNGSANLQVCVNPTPPQPPRSYIPTLLDAPETAQLKRNAEMIYPNLSTPPENPEVTALLRSYAEIIAVKDSADLENLLYALTVDLKAFLL